MEIQNHTDLSDDQFLKSFSTYELHPGLFNHEAHLRLAYLHITRHGLEAAKENITDQIQCYVAKFGAQDKYHHTLTIASVRAVAHFILRAPEADFSKLVEKFPGMKTNFKGLMDAHYGIDIFACAKAKTSYIDPDLLPFD